MLEWITQVLPSQDKNIPHTAEKFDYIYIYVFVSLSIYHKARSKLQQGSGARELLLLLLSHFSRVRLCATPWTAAHQAPQSMGSHRVGHD